MLKGSLSHFADFVMPHRKHFVPPLLRLKQLASSNAEPQKIYVTLERDVQDGFNPDIQINVTSTVCALRRLPQFSPCEIWFQMESTLRILKSYLLTYLLNSLEGLLYDSCFWIHKRIALVAYVGYHHKSGVECCLLHFQCI